MSHMCMDCGNDEHYCVCMHNPVGGSSRRAIKDAPPKPKPFAWCVPGINAFERGEECPAGWIGKAIPLYAETP